MIKSICAYCEAEIKEKGYYGFCNTKCHDEWSKQNKRCVASPWFPYIPVQRLDVKELRDRRFEESKPLEKCTCECKSGTYPDQFTSVPICIDCGKFKE